MNVLNPLQKAGRRLLKVRLENNWHMALFTLTGTVVVLAIVAVGEVFISRLLGTVLWIDMVRGLTVGTLIAIPAFFVNAVILRQHSLLNRRYKAAFRLANRNSEALAEKNEELEITRMRLAELANSDFLTGLANRRRFEEALVRAFSDAEEGRMTFALFLLDLDAFKPVNDTYGHDAGDAVLRHTGVRIRKALSEREGLAARLGGDEFAVLLWDASDNHDVQHFASALTEMLAEPQAYQGDILTVTATVGASLYSSNFLSASDMFVSTDQRLIALKQRNQSDKKRKDAVIIPDDPRLAG